MKHDGLIFKLKQHDISSGPIKTMKDFLLSGFFFTDIDNSQDSKGREGIMFLFHSTTSTRSRTFRHFFATLHVRWLSRFFNRNACVYQTATRWDFPPYRITIWLIDDVTLSFCLFTWWFDCRFLLQQFETGNRWIRTLIDYHPCITSEPANQVCQSRVLSHLF